MYLSLRKLLRIYVFAKNHKSENLFWLFQICPRKALGVKITSNFLGASARRRRSSQSRREERVKWETIKVSAKECSNLPKKKWVKSETGGKLAHKLYCRLSSKAKNRL
jgi:hypothetical protein